VGPSEGKNIKNMNVVKVKSPIKTKEVEYEEAWNYVKTLKIFCPQW
jgi:hypothetical protein